MSFLLRRSFLPLRTMRQILLSALVMGLICSCMNRPTPVGREGASHHPPSSDGLSASLGEEFDDEEPISLPPGLNPAARVSPKYTHLTPGNLQVFDWPVDEARLSRGYFLKDPRGRKRRPHLGIDLANYRGTPIYAAHDGVVIYSGSGFRGYGRMIMVESPKGDFATLYAHLNKSRVRTGMQVRQGDRIGDMGNTGRSTGPHLHFEIRTLQGPVDPMAFLPPVSNTRPSNLFGKIFNIKEEVIESPSAEAL